MIIWRWDASVGTLITWQYLWLVAAGLVWPLLVMIARGFFLLLLLFLFPTVTLSHFPLFAGFLHKRVINRCFACNKRVSCKKRKLASNIFGHKNRVISHTSI